MFVGLQGTQSEVEKHESEWTAHMDIFLKNALLNGTITQVSLFSSKPLKYKIVNCLPN